MIALRKSIRENQIVYFYGKRLHKTVLWSIHFDYACLMKKKSFSDYIIKNYEMLKMYNGPNDFTDALPTFSNLEDRISWTSSRPWNFWKFSIIDFENPLNQFLLCIRSWRKCWRKSFCAWHYTDSNIKNNFSFLIFVIFSLSRTKKKTSSIICLKNKDDHGCKIDPVWTSLSWTCHFVKRNIYYNQIIFYCRECNFLFLIIILIVRR